MSKFRLDTSVWFVGRAVVIIDSKGHDEPVVTTITRLV
jgi:hypothetical protein